MKRSYSLLFLLLAFLTNGAAVAVEIVGAGASLPSPIYQKWGDDIRNDMRLVYQSVGSGNGIELVKAGKVDFGTSDHPLTAQELEQNNLVQFPAIVGAVVPVVNIEGIAPGQLKLDGETLARIYLGKIAKWNDPAIVAMNRDLKLPDAPIAVVYRSDSSGSTFLFTNYLSKVSTEWRNSMGEGNKVNWKTGTGGQSGSTVIGYVQRLKNSIGYVDYYQVAQNALAHVQLKNRTGQFVSPNVASIRSAALNAHWDRSTAFYEILTDQQGNSWPIAGASYVLMHKVQKDATVAQAVLKFFDWGYSNGVPAAERLNFVSLPAGTQQSVRTEWRARIRDNQGNPVW